MWPDLHERPFFPSFILAALFSRLHSCALRLSCALVPPGKEQFPFRKLSACHAGGEFADLISHNSNVPSSTLGKHIPAGDNAFILTVLRSIMIPLVLVYRHVSIYSAVCMFEGGRSTQKRKHEAGQDVTLWAEAGELFVPVGIHLESLLACQYRFCLSESGWHTGLCKWVSSYEACIH